MRYCHDCKHATGNSLLPRIAYCELLADRLNPIPLQKREERGIIPMALIDVTKLEECRFYRFFPEERPGGHDSVPNVCINIL